MSENQKKLTFKDRPRMAPCEKKGVAIIVALLLATYVLVIQVLGGQVSGEPFLSLDPTGHLHKWAQRWVNASIPYRERMVPVFIITFYYYMFVLVITFMTRSWENMRKWAAYPRHEFWRLYATVILVLVGSVIYFTMGKTYLIENPRQLSRFFERPAFANKYSFVLMLGMLTIFSYSMAQIVSILGVKTKLVLTKEKQHG